MEESLRPREETGVGGGKRLSRESFWSSTTLSSSVTVETAQDETGLSINVPARLRRPQLTEPLAKFSLDVELCSTSPWRQKTPFPGHVPALAQPIAQHSANTG